MRVSTSLTTILLLPLLALSAPIPDASIEERAATTTASTGPKVTTGTTWYNPSFTAGSNGHPSTPSAYHCYSGPAANFPARATWMSFENMWALNVKYSLKPIGDTATEQQDIYNAIVEVSQQALVDARVILGVIIQESTGNVRVPCTNNGVKNCGLMQSYDSPNATYNPHNMQASITQMIRDGVQGTLNPVTPKAGQKQTGGPGLVQYFNSDPSTGHAATSGNVWEVLRYYNSGSINQSNLSKGLGSTPSYVSDIANRILGWNGYGNGGASCKFS